MVPDIGDDDVVETIPRIARARRWCVVFYNDDHTLKVAAEPDEDDGS